VVISFSWYWPALGGVNGNPHGRVARGDPWSVWAERGAACPVDWPFGTQVVLDDVVYTCVDRGAFVGYTRDGRPIVDFLTETPAHNFRERITVSVFFPGDVLRLHVGVDEP
jgi:hypothetical protein